MKKNKKIFILIVIGIVCSLIISLLFLFNKKDNSINKWANEDKEGEIKIDDNQIEDINEHFYDDNGIEYQKKKFINWGVEMFVPIGFTIDSSNPDTIYFKSNSESFKGVEISISMRGKGQGIKDVSEVPRDFMYFIRHNLKYHLSDTTILSNPEYFYNDEITNPIYNSGRKVWVNTDFDKDFVQHDKFPTEIQGNFEERDYLKGFSEIGNMSMLDDSGATIVSSNIHYSFYWTLNRNQVYLISAFSPNNYADLGDLIAKTIFDSFKPLENIEILYPDFSEPVSFSLFDFKIPKSFKIDFNDTQFFKAVDYNFHSNTFGMGIYGFAFNLDDTVQGQSLDPEINYNFLTHFLGSYSSPYIKDIATSNLIELKGTFFENTIINIDGKDVYSYYFMNYLLTKGSPLEVDINRAFPVYQRMYAYVKNKSVYVISFVSGFGAKEFNDKIAQSLVSTIQISD